MAKRYELPEAAWELIKDLSSPEQKMGRPRSDDRLLLNSIFCFICSRALRPMVDAVSTALRQYCDRYRSSR